MNVCFLGGTSGLGRALAIECLARGHAVTVAGRSAGRMVEGDPLARARERIRLNLLDIVGLGDNTTDPGAEQKFVQHAAVCDVLFWVAGTWLRQPFGETERDKLDRLIAVHFWAPVCLLNAVLKRRDGDPLHLVTISSSSALKVRDDGQALYGGLQAAKVQFARNLHAEDAVQMSTIVRPGGMKTGFFVGSGVDTTRFADPVEVAEAICSHVFVESRPPLLELDIAQDGGQLSVRPTPDISFRP